MKSKNYKTKKIKDKKLKYSKLADRAIIDLKNSIKIKDI